LGCSGPNSSTWVHQDRWARDPAGNGSLAWRAQDLPSDCLMGHQNASGGGGSGFELIAHSCHPPIP
jgi:hypothetical protein